MVNKEYERMITFIKPNDVFYSRDIHAIDIMNKIISDSSFNMEIKNKLFLIITKGLDKNNIKYEIDSTYNFIMIKEDSWDSIIIKKNGNFIFKEFYEVIKESHNEDLIYNTKLTFINKAQLDNFNLDTNTIIINSDFIDDIKLLKMNGIDLNKNEFIIRESEYIDFILKNVNFRGKEVYLYINMFTSSIDDLVEIYNKIKDDSYIKGMFKNVKISMMFITLNEYNKSKIDEYNKLNVPAYGLINIFDQTLISKLKVNNLV